MTDGQETKRTYLTLAYEMLAHFLLPKAKRPDTISMNITCNADGTTSYHFGEMIAQSSETVGLWMIQAAKAMANGLMPAAWSKVDDYNVPIDLDYLNGIVGRGNAAPQRSLSQHMVANTKASDIKTVNQAVNLLGWVIGNTPKSAKPILHNYISVGKNACAWARDPRTKAEKDAGKVASQPVPTAATATLDPAAIAAIVAATIAAMKGA